MALSEQKADDYFEELGKRAEENRCLHCGTGMVLENLLFRRCPSCKFEQESEQFFIHTLRFETKINELDFSVTISAYNGRKLCYVIVKETVEYADAYIEEMMRGHVSNVKKGLASV